MNMQPLLQRLASIGARSEDTPEERLRTGALVLAAVAIAAISFVWIGVYLANGEPVAASIPFVYQIITVVGLVALARSKSCEIFRTMQLTMWLLLPALLQAVLGGFVASSGVVLWSVMVPLAAVALLGLRSGRNWLLAFLVTIGVLALLNGRLSQDPAVLPQALVVALIVMNISGLTLGAFVLLGYFVHQSDLSRAALAVERERSEALLRNVLPASIAERLKAGEGVIADRFDEVTVLFADLEGFTRRSAAMPPDRVVALLDRVFSSFDAIADAEGLEKIKTIGDAYMVVGGAPETRPDHAAAVATVALAMRHAIDELSDDETDALRLRIGIDTGPAVAGVIGQRKFSYDLWGDTVNTASRMESHGIPGEIQVTARCAAALGDAFELQARGPIEVKGKGMMETFLLLGERGQSTGRLRARR